MAKCIYRIPCSCGSVYIGWSGRSGYLEFMKIISVSPLKNIIIKQNTECFLTTLTVVHTYHMVIRFRKLGKPQFLHTWLVHVHRKQSIRCILNGNLIVVAVTVRLWFGSKIELPCIKVRVCVELLGIYSVPFFPSWRGKCGQSFEIIFTCFIYILLFIWNYNVWVFYTRKYCELLFCD